MFLEIILVMILIFLIIIASQNYYARGRIIDQQRQIIDSITFQTHEISERCYEISERCYEISRVPSKNHQSED
jgi:hypothetical protein